MRRFSIRTLMAVIVVSRRKRGETIDGSFSSAPAPPLALKPPPGPSAILEGTDLKKVDANRLAAAARRLYDDKQYPQAIQLLHYAVKRGANGGYDLACDYALAGKSDAALYWLQKSALDEGVDAGWADQDGDLEI